MCKTESTELQSLFLSWKLGLQPDGSGSQSSTMLRGMEVCIFGCITPLPEAACTVPTRPLDLIVPTFDEFKQKSGALALSLCLRFQLDL